MRLSLHPSLRMGDYPFTHRIRTRFAETDAMGVIHHSAFVPYLEEARAALLEWLGHPYEHARNEDGVDFSVVELYVRYRLSVRFGDEVDVSVAVGRLSGATFEVAYLLTVDGESRATAVTVHGSVNAAGRATPPPPWFAQVAARAAGG